MGRRAKGWQCYDASGDTSDGGGNLHSFKEKVLLPILPKVKNKLSALDVGCGNGRHCKVLSEIFDRVVGIDIDYPFDNRFNLDNVTFYQKDFSEVSGHKFDLILFWGSFYNMQNYRETLRMCYELLTDDGIVVIGDEPIRRTDMGESGHHDGFNYDLGDLLDGVNLKEVDEFVNTYRVTVIGKY
jgi:SAM-dependent methyltransferase